MEQWVSGVEPHDAERRRLVRLCAQLSGSSEVAEDLAQETLVEAWRHEQALRDPEKRAAWLWGIARNVCKRWLRERARDGVRMPSGAQNGSGGDDVDALIGDTDVEIDLERAELATLLDRAMALLPPETRDVLVERFINELSHAEIAERLSLSEGTVKVRVHRGKLALRRVLATHFVDDLETYGFAVPTDGWHETRVWCPGCGRRTWQMRTGSSRDAVYFRCPDCDPDPELIAVMYSLTNPRMAALVGDLKRPAAILRRGSEWLYPYFAQPGIGGTAPCSRCGQSVTVSTYIREGGVWLDGQKIGLYVSCEACGEELCTSQSGFVLAIPEVMQFRREQGRVRTLPPQRIEANGRPATATRVQSVTSDVDLTVITDADTYRTLGIYRGSRLGARLEH